MKGFVFVTIFVILGIVRCSSQTAEDSVGNSKFQQTTSIGGYGSASFSRDANEELSTINLDRVVLFVGHQFSSNISFFSELELEDGKVSGGSAGGELALEQAYLKMNVDRSKYFTVGLFVPRFGLLNENHLPSQFNGVGRNTIETLLIPATWRELGVGYYSNPVGSPFRFFAALTNGVNSANFEQGNGIREGRYEGREASANSLALWGSVQYNRGHFKSQLSGYYAGSVGLNKEKAKAIGLESGIFGTPVWMSEINGQYVFQGLELKVLGCVLGIPNADKINKVYKNNTAEMGFGGYLELGYNFLERKNITKKLVGFVRYELLNLDVKIPVNMDRIPESEQRNVVVGVGYYPVPNVVIKADVKFVSFRDSDKPDFKSKNNLINLGIGYSF
jgi:hypothetical protein